MKRYTLILLLLLITMSVFSNNYLEININTGYTFVDIENLVEKDENSGSFATDWGNATSGINVQYFFKSFDRYDIGVELSYQYLYWYSVAVPYAPNPIYRTYDIDAVSLASIFRNNLADNISIDLGLSLNFSDGIHLGSVTSLNYNYIISDSIKIPLKFRIYIINMIEVIIPVTISVGIQFDM